MAVDRDAVKYELYRREPSVFRSNLLVDGPDGIAKFGTFMSPVQRADFTALDPALKYLCKVSDQKPAIQRFWQQRSRGYSKTTDLASSALYCLYACPHKLDAVVCAEDREQALLIREQMLKILQYNDWLYKFIDVQRARIKNKRTDATLNSLSRDTASSFGLTPELVIADEFTHWSQEQFWGSVFSSFNKTASRGGVLIVACNAGWGTDWKWQVREHARTSDKWYFSAPAGYAPWYNESDIEEQRAGLTPSEFGRLWLNEWQSSSGEYVSLEEADACVNDQLKKLSATEKDGNYYVASVDYAEKSDRTVGCVGELHGGKIRIVRMDVCDPEMMPDKTMPISWVEQWMLNVQHKFGGQRGHVTFIVDPYQLKYVIQRVEHRCEIEEFDFGSGVGNYELSVILRSMIVNKRIEWYRGVGEIYDLNGKLFNPLRGRDDLCSELAKLIRKNAGNGKRWRFDHIKGEHDDRAFAVGAIARHIVKNTGGIDEWTVQQPINNGEFNL